EEHEPAGAGAEQLAPDRARLARRRVPAVELRARHPAEAALVLPALVQVLAERVGVAAPHLLVELVGEVAQALEAPLRLPRRRGGVDVAAPRARARAGRARPPARARSGGAAARRTRSRTGPACRSACRGSRSRCATPRRPAPRAT